ncbi:MAG: sensor histidine kinase [Saprospiraceae bacterium]
MHRLRFLFLLFIISIFISGSRNIFGQVQIDSTYSYSHLTQMLEEARATNNHALLADTYFLLANIEGDVLNDYLKSFEYYRRSMEYYKLTSNSGGYRKASFEYGRRFLDAGYYDAAIDNFLPLIEEYQKLKDTTQLINTYLSIQRAYREKNDYEMAAKYMRNAWVITDIYGKNTVFEKNILIEKIHFFEHMYELDSALIIASRLLSISTEQSDISLGANSLYHIGYINFLNRKFHLAEKYLNKSAMLLPIKPYDTQRKELYLTLSKTHSELNNNAEAYEYLTKYTKLNDSILNKNRIESLNNFALKYGTKDIRSNIEILKIDKQVAEEKNKAQRRLLYLLGVGLVIALLASYFIVQMYDQRIQKDKIISLQKEEINQQKIRELEDNLKISSMRSVIEGQEIERERVAKDLHDSLGGLLSTIKLQFDRVRSQNVSLMNDDSYVRAFNLLDTAVSEVRNISRDLQPSSLQNLGLIPALKDLINRFDDEKFPVIDFQYYDVPQKIDKMIAITIFRIVQELITNTIKHARANEILIQLNFDENDVVLQYEDDGIGINPSKQIKAGMGLENIKSRVNYLHGQIAVDTNQGEGFSVMIRLKCPT